MTDISSILGCHASHGRMLYFAYGSNINLLQMAERCPRSIFVGNASLPAYRWQINERGVANVVRSRHEYVEGLVFLVDAEDERSLDRSEGVSREYYQKYLAWIDLTPHEPLYMLKTSLVALELERQGQYSYRHSTAVPRKRSSSLPPPSTIKVQRTRRPNDLVRRSTSPKTLPISQYDLRKQRDSILAATVGKADKLQQKTLGDRRQGLLNHKLVQQMKPPLRVKALVYISERYASDGFIREEYIARMRKAMVDGLKLGISPVYVGRYLDPLVNLEGVNPGHAKLIKPLFKSSH